MKSKLITLTLALLCLGYGLYFKSDLAMIAALAFGIVTVFI